MISLNDDKPPDYVRLLNHEVICMHRLITALSRLIIQAFPQYHYQLQNYTVKNERQISYLVHNIRIILLSDLSHETLNGEFTAC